MVEIFRRNKIKIELENCVDDIDDFVSAMKDYFFSYEISKTYDSCDVIYDCEIEFGLELNSVYRIKWKNGGEESIVLVKRNHCVDDAYLINLRNKFSDYYLSNPNIKFLGLSNDLCLFSSLIDVELIEKLSNSLEEYYNQKKESEVEKLTYEGLKVGERFRVGEEIFRKVDVMGVGIGGLSESDSKFRVFEANDVVKRVDYKVLDKPFSTFYLSEGDLFFLEGFGIFRKEKGNRSINIGNGEVKDCFCDDFVFPVVKI